MSHGIRVIITCSALTIFIAVAAQAGDHRVSQQVVGSAISLSPYQSELIAEARGTGGPAAIRSLLLLGGITPNTSAICSGFAAENPIVGGSSVVTHPDLSLTYSVVASGATCIRADGTTRTIVNFLVVGGTGRYQGASGNLRVETDNVILEPTFPIQSAGTGTITGTITVGN